VILLNKRKVTEENWQANVVEEEAKPMKKFTS
jgi:hypothetical protein